MYIRVENNIPCGSPQTLTESREGWVPFVKSDQNIDFITQTVSYVYDAENNRVLEQIDFIDDVNSAIMRSVRSTRDHILSSCDYTQISDVSLSDEKKSEWAEYRQALRDMPETHSQATSLDDIIWPIKPE